MTDKNEARDMLMGLHRQICYEVGTRPDEVDTAYSIGADAIFRADLSDAKDKRIAELEEKLVRVERDKTDLMRSLGEMLARVDEAYTPDDGGLSMHAYGQTPDWFVEAAILSIYGTLHSRATRAELKDTQ